jgi:hypothetical protein
MTAKRAKDEYVRHRHCAGFFAGGRTGVLAAYLAVVVPGAFRAALEVHCQFNKGVLTPPEGKPFKTIIFALQ